MIFHTEKPNPKTEQVVLPQAPVLKPNHATSRPSVLELDTTGRDVEATVNAQLSTPEDDRKSDQATRKRGVGPTRLKYSNAFGCL